MTIREVIEMLTAFYEIFMKYFGSLFAPKEEENTDNEAEVTE